VLLGLVGTAVVAAGGAAVFAAAVMPADATVVAAGAAAGVAVAAGGAAGFAAAAVVPAAATVVAAGPSGAKPTRTPVDTALTRLTAWHAAENAAAQSGSPASSSTCM